MAVERPVNLSRIVPNTHCINCQSNLRWAGATQRGSVTPEVVSRGMGAVGRPIKIFSQRRVIIIIIIIIIIVPNLVQLFVKR